MEDIWKDLDFHDLTADIGYNCRVWPDKIKVPGIRWKTKKMQNFFFHKYAVILPNVRLLIKIPVQIAQLQHLSDCSSIHIQVLTSGMLIAC